MLPAAFQHKEFWVKELNGALYRFWDGGNHTSRAAYALLEPCASCVPACTESTAMNIQAIQLIVSTGFKLRKTAPVPPVPRQ
jgi:hypothetical protein